MSDLIGIYAGPRMTVVDVVCFAAGWQGGTIHQVVAHCKKYGKRGTISYQLGVGEKAKWANPRHVLYEPNKNMMNWLVPVNGFSHKHQIFDYVLGLLDAGLPS